MMIFGIQSNQKKKNMFVCRWLCDSNCVLPNTMRKTKNTAHHITQEYRLCLVRINLSNREKNSCTFLERFWVKHKASAPPSSAIAVARKQLQCDFSLRIFNENINQFFLTSSNCFYLLLLLLVFCWFLIACRRRQSFRRSAYTHSHIR